MTELLDLSIDCLGFICQNIDSVRDVCRLMMTNKVMGLKLKNISKGIHFDLVNVNVLSVASIIGSDRINKIVITEPKILTHLHWSDTFLSELTSLTEIKIDSVFKLKSLALLPNLKKLSVDGLTFTQGDPLLHKLETMVLVNTSNITADFWHSFPRLSYLICKGESQRIIIDGLETLTKLDLGSANLSITQNCMKNITSMSFENKIKHSFLRRAQNLTSVTIINPKENFLATISQTHMHTLTKLNIKQYSRDSVTKTIDIWIYVSKFTQLEELSLIVDNDYYQYGKLSFSGIANMPLKYLYLNLDIEFIGHQYLLKLQTLKYLHLARARDDEKLHYFASKLNLEEIVLSINNDMWKHLPLYVTIPKIKIINNKPWDYNWLTNFLKYVEKVHPKLKQKTSQYIEPHFHTLEFHDLSDMRPSALMFSYGNLKTILQRFYSYTKKGQLKYFNTNIFSQETQARQAQSNEISMIPALLTFAGVIGIALVSAIKSPATFFSK
jgi:hypothetical protein